MCQELYRLSCLRVDLTWLWVNKAGTDRQARSFGNNLTIVWILGINLCSQLSWQLVARSLQLWHQSTCSMFHEDRLNKREDKRLPDDREPGCWVGVAGGRAVSCAKRVEAIEGECIHCVLCDFNCLFLFYLWSLALVHSLQRAVRSPSRSWHHDMVRHHHKSQYTLFVCSSLITQGESQQVLAEFSWGQISCPSQPGDGSLCLFLMFKSFLSLA